MENPFRSEAAAFRFLLLTIGAFALIAIGSIINTWLGLAVALGLSLVAVGVYFRQRGEAPSRHRVVAPSDRHRILVVANETVEGDELLEKIRERSSGRPAELYVVSPALNSKLRHWTSDEDAAREAAQARLDRSLARLGGVGLQARGDVGDADPLQAVEDALRIFGADEIVLSTHPEGRSHWLERGVVDSVRERFDVPVTHVVVDLEASRV
jgi:GABA permease